jgi:hypothetical protein
MHVFAGDIAKSCNFGPIVCVVSDAYMVHAEKLVVLLLFPNIKRFSAESVSCT